MPLALVDEPLPLVTGPDGVIRVSGTRVTLDTVVASFREGATAEEIVQQYPTLPLGDVYAVLGFVLRREADENLDNDVVRALLLDRCGQPLPHPMAWVSGVV